MRDFFSGGIVFLAAGKHAFVHFQSIITHADWTKKPTILRIFVKICSNITWEHTPNLMHPVVHDPGMLLE